MMSKVPPRKMARYLLPGEHAVICLRRHPVILAGPVLVAGLAAVVALTLSVVAPEALAAAGWLVALGLAARLAWRALNWYVDYFAVTSQRLTLITGALTRSVDMVPLGKVTDLGYERTVGGRWLGYATFIVETAGEAQGIGSVDYLPYPDQLYHEVCGILFGDVTKVPVYGAGESGGDND
jgi:membrane protein YdbS with pleckstrin-like domain